MTYENWCKHSKKIIKQSEVYNRWADKAKANLLINIGPRIAKLGRVGYMGCGFHYSLEKTFGNLIVNLAISWQPSANWCENVEADINKGIISQVIYKGLLKQVTEAEESVEKVTRT